MIILLKKICSLLEGCGHVCQAAANSADQASSIEDEFNSNMDTPVDQALNIAAEETLSDPVARDASKSHTHIRTHTKPLCQCIPFNSAIHYRGAIMSVAHAKFYVARLLTCASHCGYMCDYTCLSTPCG